MVVTINFKKIFWTLYIILAGFTFTYAWTECYTDSVIGNIVNTASEKRFFTSLFGGAFFPLYWSIDLMEKYKGVDRSCEVNNER